jgi:hypothetical protein
LQYPVIMRRIQVIILLLFIAQALPAQRTHIGVFGGLAAYQGDLTNSIFPKKVTNGAIGITLNYELKDRIMLRGGFTYGIVGGADRFSGDAELEKRNLAFETKIV